MTDLPPPPGAMPPPGSPDPATEAGVYAGPPAAVPAHIHPAGSPALAPTFKPGTIPLRPMTLGDFFDASFKTVRRYPGATLGFGLAVAVVAYIGPVLAALFSDLGALLTPDLDNPDAVAPVPGVGDLASLAVTMSGALLSMIGQIFVSGMVATATMAAAIGEPLTLSRAWARTKGHIWRLIGVAVLSLLASMVAVAVVVSAVAAAAAAQDNIWVTVGVGVVFGLIAACALIYVSMRFFFFASPAVVIENLGVTTAMRRSSALMKNRWWRTFGIYLLFTLVIGFASGILALPFSLGGTAALIGLDDGGRYYLALTQLGSMFTTALTAPLAGVVVCLQYLDARFRSEGLDVALMTHVEDRRRGVL